MASVKCKTEEGSGGVVDEVQGRSAQGNHFKSHDYGLRESESSPTEDEVEILLARGPSMFISGDRPVAITGLGLMKVLSELTFPISRDIALHASWQPGEEGFFYAPDKWVKQLNQRTATNSSQIFSHIAAEWIVKILNRGNYPIFLLGINNDFEKLFPYKDILSVPEEWLE